MNSTSYIFHSDRAASLEKSYLTYSHRQRQKSLIIVNAVDLGLKFVLAAVYIVQRQHDVRLRDFHDEFMLE